MTRAQSRLASLKRLLAEIHRRLELGFGFRLWDGSTVPERWPGRRAPDCHCRRRRGGRAAQGAQHHDVRQSLGGWTDRPRQRHDFRPRRAPAERPHARTAQVARDALDPAGAGAVPVRPARRPLAARRRRTGSPERRLGGREQPQHRPSLRRLQRLLCVVARPGHGLHLRLLSRLEPTISTRRSGRSST